MSSKQSPLEPFRAHILRFYSQGQSPREIGWTLKDSFGVDTSERSVRRQLNNWQEDDSCDRTEVTSATASNLDDLIKENNLDPEDWIVERSKVSKWESGNGETLKALSGSLIRKNPISLISPARSVGLKYDKPPRPSESDRLVVCVGDQQAPFYDEALHQSFLGWLEANEPEEGVLLGDTLDFSDISRHRVNPERGASVQESIQTGYELLRDYRHASPNTHWTKLPGNHDERLRNIVIDQLINIYGITRAQVGKEAEPPILSVEHLLRLDELGIEYIEPFGQYDQAQYAITPQIAARHGWLATKGSGTTALKSLEQLGYSIVVGHSHRQSIVHKTVHDINGTTKTLIGIETGCMCNIGLGYATAEDWQQGGAVLNVNKDGSFHADLMTFKNGVLYYQDQR